MRKDIPTPQLYGWGGGAAPAAPPPPPPPPQVPTPMILFENITRDCIHLSLVSDVNVPFFLHLWFISNTKSVLNIWGQSISGAASYLIMAFLSNIWTGEEGDKEGELDNLLEVF